MKTLLAAGILTVTVLAVRAGVVFDQPHDGSGTLHHSSRYQPNGTAPANEGSRFFHLCEP